MLPYAALMERYAEMNALEGAISLMSWDQQVLMPSGGAVARAEHVQSLSRMLHALRTSDGLRRALEDASRDVDPDSIEGANVARFARDVDKWTKLPPALVDRKAAASSAAYETWKRAKATNDFPLLAPFLAELFEIARETSACLGGGEHVYDPLIDLYEEGSTYAQAREMFDRLAPFTHRLLSDIRERGTAIDDSRLSGNWDRERLRAFAQRTASTIGFRFDDGRLDTAPNAFCSHLSASDVRMTTRATDHIKGIVSSSLHEMGHGLYEQGTPSSWDRTPLAGGISLGVHESQSRLWENIVGRRESFWSYFLPDLATALPELSDVAADDFTRMFNRVESDFTRVGSDELTYNLHILVRFELEVEILTGTLAIQDLPEAWNAKYTEHLGITPPTDTLGVLQDVHWSRGSVGYFPTYTMGNLIGAQMWECLVAELGDVDADMARGDFTRILGWLTDRVYRHGRRYSPAELIQQVTGRPMAADAWISYADAKYRTLYGL